MLTPNTPVPSITSPSPRLRPLRAAAVASPPLIHETHTLHLSAIAADAAATAEISLSLLWRELTRGVSRVVHGFFSHTRCYLLVSTATAAPIEGRRLEILESVLSGLRQKNVAMDLELAPSTVALNSRLGLESLGVVGKPSRAHPLLMLAARAAAEPAQLSARLAHLSVGRDTELRVIGAARSDRALVGVLPPAELAVIGSLIEGLTYQEIARARGTSTRTIANQISAVFRRLRVSGRNELVHRLFGGGGLEPARDTTLPPACVDAGAAPFEDARRSA